MINLLKHDALRLIGTAIWTIGQPKYMELFITIEAIIAKHNKIVISQNVHKSFN